MLPQSKQQTKYRLARGRRFGAVVATLAMASVILLGCNSPEEQDLMQPTPDQPPGLDAPPSFPPPADTPPAANPPADTPKDEADSAAPDDDQQDEDAAAPGDG